MELNVPTVDNLPFAALQMVDSDESRALGEAAGPARRRRGDRGAAIEASLAAVEQKLAAMRNLAARHTTVHLGMPDLRGVVARTRRPLPTEPAVPAHRGRRLRPGPRDGADDRRSPGRHSGGAGGVAGARAARQAENKAVKA
ncbi:hypothetical protein ACFYZT_32980 [Streptomyces sp. NPDC001591]|uniref:hypothetical protein n=1 Tax=unclassified Streptomyces TaxID=2593676 RepID=UPI00339EAD6E